MFFLLSCEVWNRSSHSYSAVINVRTALETQLMVHASFSVPLKTVRVKINHEYFCSYLKVWLNSMCNVSKSCVRPLKIGKKKKKNIPAIDLTSHLQFSLIIVAFCAVMWFIFYHRINANRVFMLELCWSEPEMSAFEFYLWKMSAWLCVVSVLVFPSFSMCKCVCVINGSERPAPFNTTLIRHAHTYTHKLTGCTNPWKLLVLRF